MNVNIIQLLTIFDELTPATNEEQGIYWFRTVRSDGLIIVFSFSIYESYVDIVIRNTSEVDIASLSLENCSVVKILDEKRKCLEILRENAQGRCFLSLHGSSVLNYQEIQNSNGGSA